MININGVIYFLIVLSGRDRAFCIPDSIGTKFNFALPASCKFFPIEIHEVKEKHFGNDRRARNMILFSEQQKITDRLKNHQKSPKTKRVQERLYPYIHQPFVFVSFL
jgi:hypothetical protein